MFCTIRFLFVLIVQSSLSGIHALDTCNSSTLRALLGQVTVPEVSLTTMAFKDFWFVLITSDDAEGVDSELLNLGDINEDSTLDANYTINYSNGSSIVLPVHIVQKTTYLSETQPDGEYRTHAFPCASNLTANYRCKTEGANGRPFFDVFANTKYSLEDLSLELSSCQELLSLVAPGAEFTQLSHP